MKECCCRTATKKLLQVQIYARTMLNQITMPQWQYYKVPVIQFLDNILTHTQAILVFTYYVWVIKVNKSTNILPQRLLISLKAVVISRISFLIFLKEIISFLCHHSLPAVAFCVNHAIGSVAFEFSLKILWTSSLEFELISGYLLKR